MIPNNYIGSSSGGSKTNSSGMGNSFLSGGDDGYGAHVNGWGDGNELGTPVIAVKEDK